MAIRKFRINPFTGRLDRVATPQELEGEYLTGSVYDVDADAIIDKAENVDDGEGNASTASQVKEAVLHKDLKNNPHVIELTDFGIATGTVGSDIDDAVTHKDLTDNPHTVTVEQLGLDTGISAEDINDAVTHKDLINNPHVVTVDQLDLATGTVASDVDDAVDKKHDRQHSIVASADHSDKADYIDIPYSPTILTGGVLSEGTNVGTIKISALTVLIRISDSTTGALAKITLAEQDNKTMTSADTIYYVVLDYNGGSPQIIIQEAEPNNNNQINIGRCMKESDNTIHYRNSGNRFQNVCYKINRRAEKLREYEIGSGIQISDEGSKNLAISTGYFFRGVTEFSFSGFDTSKTSPDTFTYVYYDGDVTGGGEWVYIDNQTEIDVDNYNDVATGLDSFNRYKSDWVFVHPEMDMVFIVYGQVDGTVGQISDSEVPSNLPDLIDRFGTLIGRIFIDNGVATFYRIETVQRTTFNPQVVIDHNDNSSIQGGTTDQYYHLSSADYTELTQWLDNITLGSDGKLTLVSGTAINEFSTDGTLAGDSDDAVPTEKAVKTYADTKSDKHISINTPDLSGTGVVNYTLVLTDDGKLIDMSDVEAEDLTLTVPANASVAFPIGTTIALRQKGTGTVTITPVTGVTVDAKDGGLVTTGQHAMASILKVDTDTWVATGALEA